MTWLTVDAKAVRLAEETRGRYLKAISLLMVLWDFLKSIMDSLSDTSVDVVEAMV